MHRFRKRSDAKRGQAPDFLHDSEGLLELPPISTFRTSLILPDLTRRFTLLRTASGDPVSLDALRTRFAEQRARGAENQISEEEEDMILETLDRLSSENTRAGANAVRGSPSRNMIPPDSERQSFRSTDSTISSATPGHTTLPATARFTKRHSNNLFGSGRFRDETYLRSVMAQKTGSQRSAVSVAPTESSATNEGSEPTHTNSLRPTTPEDPTLSSSVQSSPEKTDAAEAASMQTSASYSDLPISFADYHIASSAAFRRASLALKEVINEIEEEAEEEAEDEIVMPRSVPPSRAVVGEHNTPTADTNGSPTSSVVEAGMAISSDKQVTSESESRTSPVPPCRPGTTSPTPRLPGYIPGMPRPMTPRDLVVPDTEDTMRSHSTTPRATSPVLPNLNGFASSPLSGSLRRDSNTQSSRFSPRPTSPSSSPPLFVPRTPNGNSLAEILRTGDGFSMDIESSLDSSNLGRRLPASPLSGSTYQPMTVSPRPSTPSNITWNVQTGPNVQVGASGHRRQGSWLSDNSAAVDLSSTLGRSKSNARSLRSPALPDSPLLERASSPGWNTSVDPPVADKRSLATKDAREFISPLFTNRVPRSPTPTQNAPQSPASPTFSNYDLSPANSPRSSKQTAPSSHFSIGSFHPLVFSPLANSSRSSLESAGSSYHSCDGDRQKDRNFNLFNDGGTPQSVWHDIPTTDKSSSANPGDSKDESGDAEGIIERYAGLTKSDILAIQEKLVGAANATPDARERVPSLRRRRPSTSQSNYSVNGREAKVGSPLPRSLSPISSPQNDKSLKGTALLDSVVDSIRSPRVQTFDITSEERLGVVMGSDKEPSPTTRRNRDLAQVLFGTQERPRKEPSVQLPTLIESTTKVANVSDRTPSNPARNSPSPDSTDSSTETTEAPVASRHEQQLSPQSVNGGHTSRDQVDLVVEVQRKTDAAMMALQRSPSQAIADRGSVTGSISRRRISPGQISTPRLVSASTSVDTIPLRSSSVASGNIQGPSKLSQRFRRLRGTLRTKPPTFYTDDTTPDPVDDQPPPASQLASYDPASLKVPGGPTASSATEMGTFKFPIPSPPASAAPGLRGFMARFRKHRTVDMSQEQVLRSSYQSPPYTPTVSASTPTQRETPVISKTVPEQHDTSSSRYVPPPSRNEAMAFNSSTTPVTPTPVPATNVDGGALKQLFAAANDLGLDQAALNDLLARSGSLRSSGWPRPGINNMATTNGETGDPQPDRALSPTLSEPRTSTDSRPGEIVVHKTSVRKAPDTARRPRPIQDENTAAVNAIVRRTIIFPSESRSSTIDLNILMRKPSQTTRHRRSTSVNSGSSRSVHDRVPTPPPPRSSTGKRFSSDNSPPVPQLPMSFSSLGENSSTLKPASAGPIEKSSSTYDSLYEMYAEDSKPLGPGAGDSLAMNSAQPSRNADSDLPPGPDSGPALEVIEMANGETIWSIVNGLRDDDAESLYGNRGSFASDYSLREPNGTNGNEVLVKEHGRKNSNPSFLSRKKSQGRSRPETKVFYSTSAQIGRLIENLSQGMDAGSFNIMPHSPSGHSHSSSLQSESEINWTVEERLEHMLGSLGNA